jgi:hypothetical protein
MADSTTFTRVYGDEFMCVRRAGYYTFIYAGRPMPEWHKLRRTTDAQRQFPRTGGGVCLFWTPGFGSSIVAKNWSACASQAVIAQRADGADWEDYWSVRSAFDAAAGTARITSAMLNQPVKISRDVRFLNDAVHMDLALQVEMPPRATAIFESFPYPLDKPRPLRVRLLDEHGHSVQDRPASAICFDDGGPECHVIVFDRPRLCEVRTDRSTDLYNQQREHGCVLAQIPGALDVGPARARWIMRACPTAEVPQVVVAAIARLRDHTNE